MAPDCDVKRVICVIFDGANESEAFFSVAHTPNLHDFRNHGLLVHALSVLPSNSRCVRHAAFTGCCPSVSGIALPSDPTAAREVATATENVFDVAADYGLGTAVGVSGQLSVRSYGLGGCGYCWSRWSGLV